MGAVYIRLGQSSEYGRLSHTKSFSIDLELYSNPVPFVHVYQWAYLNQAIILVFICKRVERRMVGRNCRRGCGVEEEACSLNKEIADLDAGKKVLSY